MTVQIVTDSGSDLSPELAAMYGVAVAPLQVMVGEKTYRAGVDLSPQEFYRAMRAARELPKTSQPTPHDMINIYRQARERGPVVGIHLSGALSGTYQSAVMAAREVDPAIVVIDSRTGSGALTLMVLEAAAMAADGADQTDIGRRVESMRSESRTFVALNTLENAVKGGRVSPITGMAASLLGIKPIVQVTDDGRVETIDRVRGRARALQRLIDLAAATHRDWANTKVSVGHSDCPDDAAAFAVRVQEQLRPRAILPLAIGAVIGTYAAEGAILLSF